MSYTYVGLLPALPARPDDGHKGTFGRLLIIGGSRGMSGAAALAGLGGLRGGAGLVELAVSESVLPIVAAIEPSYLVRGLAEDSAGRLGRSALPELRKAAELATAVGVGPGLGRSEELDEVVAVLYRELTQPAVFDADAINAMAPAGEHWPRAAGARVLTPHPGEFARLTGLPIAEVLADREALAADWAKRLDCVIVLKGSQTVISDGPRVAVNQTGNSGLATGGTGDVLTGLIAALLAQGMTAFDAAQLGCYLHGLAGDLAAEEKSRPGLIASDLPQYLARAWRQAGA